MNPFHHLLDTSQLTRDHIHTYLETASSFLDTQDNIIRKPLLAGQTVTTLFFESSTRTRSAFTLAAKRLGADVLNVNIAHSATTKGETLRDTLANLDAMQTDIFVLRHPDSGAAHFAATQVKPTTSVINAGDGRHAHPTQALTDIFTISRYKKTFSSLKIAIVGDILHSRVARSQIPLFHQLQVSEIRAVGPRTLLPLSLEKMGVRVYHSMAEGIKDVDVVIMLRLQKERMQQGLLPHLSEYFHLYGLSESLLETAAPDAIILHPGPMNRGVEISSSVADSPQSVILNQVHDGVAMRMAVLSLARSV